MAQHRDHHFNPSSPRSSSGGADSFRGTPDTRLTSFSPGDGSVNSRSLKELGHSAPAIPPARLPLSGSHASISHLDRDPFVTPTHSNGTKLSPTASSFNPYTATSRTALSSIVPPVSTILSNDLGLSRHLDVTSSTSISVSEVEAFLAELEMTTSFPHGSRRLKACDGRVHICFADIRDSCSAYAGMRYSKPEWKADYARPTQCENMPESQQTPLEKAILRSGQMQVVAVPVAGFALGILKAMGAVQSYLQSFGQIFAFITQSAFPDGSSRAIVEFCDVTAALPFTAVIDQGVTIENIRVIVAPYTPDIGTSWELVGALQNLSLESGLEAMPQQQTERTPVTSASVLNGDMGAHQFIATYPFASRSSFAPTSSYVLDRFPTMGHVAHCPPIAATYPYMGSIYQTPPSPALTAQHTYSPSRPLAEFGRPDARRQNAARVNRSYHSTANHHNHVEISRIREGIDVRTTIMLRNIPNKVDQTMLKRIVDESSWGKYDFMYLRIDFANDCNVGYAFINFVDPLDIIDVSKTRQRDYWDGFRLTGYLKFVEARGNQRWNCFKSDKVAEISYATIQGKDCLVQKFRNSSVMLEAPHYRPKLYFTSNGPMPELAGQEESFPEPDNQSKMKRSCENAEHVGLFTPNAGQHFRDEQRRRRSQYDRGTRLAALEEYDYEAAFHQHFCGTPSR